MTASITILTNTSGYMTKVFSRNNDGSINKSPAANLYKGHFEVTAIAALSELDACLSKLKPSQVVTYGRPAALNGEVVADHLLSQTPGAISRTRANWTFPHAQGILMLD